MQDVDTVGIIGLGLMGGSLARDLAGRGVRVLAQDLDEDTMKAAEREGVIAGPLGEDLAGLETAEVVIVAVPVLRVPEVLRKASHNARSAALITDVGSTKRSVARAAAQLEIDDRFVGSHPLTGDHRSGWKASRAGMYHGARVFLCPGRAGPVAVDLAAGLWSSVGARVEFMDPDAHDHLVAWTSHLPQMSATALALALERAGFARSALGPGGREATRLAGSSPSMWADVALDNRGNLVEALQALAEAMEELSVSLRGENSEGLFEALSRGQGWALGCEE